MMSTCLLAVFACRLAMAQSNQEWIALKAKCGLSPSLVYNDWVASGSPCPANSAATTAPALPADLNQALVSAAQDAASQLGYAFGRWLVSGGNQADQQRAAHEQAQREAVMRELQRQTEEAERQKRVAEARRLQEMFDRLARTMKLNGLPDLHLKGLDSGPELRLKGHADSAGGLQLKLGDKAEDPGYGIPGLPGIYTHGPRDGQSSPGPGLSGEGVPTGGLQLKLGDASSSQPTSTQEPGPTPQIPDFSRMTPDELARVVASLPPEAQEALVVGAQSKGIATPSAPGGDQPKYSGPRAPQVATAAPASSAQTAVEQAPSPTLGQLSEIAKHSETAVSTASDQAASMEARVGFDESATGAVDLQAVNKPLIVHPESVRSDGPAPRPSPTGNAPPTPALPAANWGNRLTLPPAQSPTSTPPCRAYKPYGAGAVEGTTWIVGFNGPRSSPNAESVRREESRRLFDQLRLAGKILKKDLDAVEISTGDSRDEKISDALQNVFDPTNYDFLIGVGASTELDLNEALRVLPDSSTLGEISTHQALYASLRGRQFGTLDCHSNGAMVCLAALRGECPDAKAEHVRLFAPQITSAAAQEWQRLIETGKVRSIELFINKGDPVTSLSYASAQAITPGTLSQALARATGGSVLASAALADARGVWTVGADVAALLSTYELVPEAIHRDAPGIYIHPLFDDCREKDHQDLEGLAINKALALASLGSSVAYDWNWNCHNWMRYQKLVGSSRSAPVTNGGRP
jgi:hypothetical protein